MFYTKNLTFRILGVFLVKRPPKEADDFDRDFTAFSYRIAGDTVFCTSKGEKYAPNGSVVYLPAGVDFHRSSRSAEEIVVVHLDADGDVGEDIEIFSDLGELEFYFRDLYNTWVSGGEAAYNKCMSILYTIFAKLAEKSVQDNGIGIVDKGIRMMQTRFRDPNISVAALARECSVSEVYFRRLFRRKFGLSPLDMLLGMRFECAKELLSSGYYSIKQAALMSGFCDVKYFRVAFKKRFGETPSDFCKRA